jgi:hypothetical protein
VVLTFLTQEKYKKFTNEKLLCLQKISKKHNPTTITTLQHFIFLSDIFSLSYFNLKIQNNLPYSGQTSFLNFILLLLIKFIYFKIDFLDVFRKKR